MDLKRPYWNMEVEPMLNTPEMKQIQNDKLVKNIGAMYANIPLNKRRMDEAGVKPSDIKSLDDLAKIPIYGQPELRQIIAEIGFDMNKILDLILG